MASRLAYRNWMMESGVTISASASATGYPVSNLASSAPWKIWRSSTTTGDQWVKFDLGSSRAMTACLLRNYLIHVGGTIKFQANATDAWGGPTVDQTFTIPSTARTKTLAVFISTQTLRWVRIYFTNTAAVSQAVELGVAFPSGYLELTYGFRPGLGFDRVDPSLVVSAVGGQQQVDQRTQQFSLTLDPNLLSATDRDNLLTVFDTVGAFIPFFLSLDETNPNLIIYGKIIGKLPVAHQGNSANLWTAPFSFLEEL